MLDTISLGLVSITIYGYRETLQSPSNGYLLYDPLPPVVTDMYRPLERLKVNRLVNPNLHPILLLTPLSLKRSGGMFLCCIFLIQYRNLSSLQLLAGPSHYGTFRLDPLPATHSHGID